MLMPFMPESPYGLLLRGKEAKASKSLRWLRGSEYDISIDIDRMKHSIQDKIQAGNVNLKQLLTDPVYRSPLLIMAVINVSCSISTITHDAHSANSQHGGHISISGNRAIVRHFDRRLLSGRHFLKGRVEH